MRYSAVNVCSYIFESVYMWSLCCCGGQFTDQLHSCVHGSSLRSMIYTVLQTGLKMCSQRDIWINDKRRCLLSNACAKPLEMWYLYSWWYGIFRTAYHFYHFTKAFTQKCKLLKKRFEKNNKIFLKPGVHLNLYFQIYIFSQKYFLIMYFFIINSLWVFYGYVSIQT